MKFLLFGTLKDKAFVVFMISRALAWLKVKLNMVIGWLMANGAIACISVEKFLVLPWTC